jgi:hypothetical protein
MELLTTQKITQNQNCNVISETEFTKENTCLGSPFLPPIVVDMI